MSSPPSPASRCAARCWPPAAATTRRGDTGAAGAARADVRQRRVGDRQRPPEPRLPARSRRACWRSAARSSSPLDGPFTVPGKGELPHFDVDFAATLAREVFRGTVLSTGRAAFVRLDGRELQGRPRVRRRPARGSGRRGGQAAAGPEGARDRPAALDQRRAGARRGAHRRRRHDAHQRQRQGRDAARGHRPPADEGRRLRRRRRRPAQPADPQADRRRRQDRQGRHLDRHRRQDPAPARRADRLRVRGRRRRRSPASTSGKINLRLRLTDVNETKLSVHGAGATRARWPTSRAAASATSSTGIGNGLTGKGASIAGAPFLALHHRLGRQHRVARALHLRARRLDRRAAGSPAVGRRTGRPRTLQPHAHALPHRDRHLERRPLPAFRRADRRGAPRGAADARATASTRC